MKTPQRELHDYISEISECADVRRGSPLPLGAHERCGGVNFAIFSRNANCIRLELFGHPEDAVPARIIDLDSARNRTGDVWHVWVEGIGPGQLYAYRMDGPYEPNEGHRFNFNKLLLGPFATATSPLPDWDFGLARGYDPLAPEQDLALSKLDNSSSMPKCVFVNESFDWDGDQPSRHPWSMTVIYETHVRGFTIHPTSGVDHPGTYRGLMEKIPYFKELGVTAVELVPVQEFNQHQVKGINPQTGQPLGNYWGYDPVVFFAPKASYSSSGGLGQQKLEFKEMVRAFHKAGIEVILDVVFNHTAEGDELGPTLCFRGMDNAIFYTLAGYKSRNYGAEGKTADAGIETLRKRQIKNFLLTLLISRGVPMLLGGDEFRRTQGGNNNAYCQDNETSWLDWNCLEQHREIFRFTRGMIAFRRAHPVLSQGQFYTDAEIHWFGSQGGLPNWTNPKEKQFACLIHEDEQSALYLMFNAGNDAVDFGLPSAPPGALWYMAVDTSQEAPQDLFAAGEELLWEDRQTYRLSPRASAILLARGTDYQRQQSALTEVK